MANSANHKWVRLLRPYQGALQKHLKQGPRANLQPAQRLGCRAVTMGLETLDMVRIHERTLVEVVLPGDSPVSRADTIRRAEAFFAEVITPLEKAHGTARESEGRLAQLTQALRRRSVDLAASKQRLKEEIAQRKAAEESLRKSEQHYRQLLDQSHRMQEQLRLLSRELLSAQEQERKRISRELHDVIAQTLTGINVRLATLKKDAGLNTKGLEENIARTQRLVEHSVKVVHRFARELRPTVLDDLGLIPALRTFLKHFSQETGIRVSLTVVAAVEQVNGDKRTTLYRVAQEALANVARHARASRARVEIQALAGAVHMTIKDNGKGFQPDRFVQGEDGKRLGLLGMRERLEMVGGSFSMSSVPGKGTTVIARIPLRHRRAAPKPG